MKHLLLILGMLITGITSAQIVDQFNFTGTVNGTNGWASHSGTPNQFQTSTGSLTYPGLPSSLGNKVVYVPGNGEDLNKALSISSDSAYYSLILNVSSDTALTLASSLTGDNFFGFGQTTSPAAVTIFGGQLRIRRGSVTGTFQLGLVNTGAGSLTPVFSSDLPINTPIFIVVKVKRATSPVQASMWINPTLGLATEPAPTMTSILGTGAFSAFGSIYLRQAGSLAAGTGNIQIDEIRASDLWTAVTPSGCATSSTLTVTNCGPYTLNSQTYTTSGAYQQVLPNANSVGCDSTINLNLTVNNPTVNNMTVSNCGPYTLNSQTYSTSGTYQQVLANANSVGCDSTINLNLSIVTSITYYEDFDNDGLGNAAVTQAACTLPLGFVLNADDCDDTDNAIGAATTWYLDADNDGFGSVATSMTSCSQPVGYVANSTDCNDALASVNPNGTEIANNGIDEDCSGSDLVITPSALGQYTFTGHTCAAPVVGVTAQPANAVFSDYAAVGALTCASGTDIFNNSGWNTSGAIDLTQYLSFSITPNSCYELDLTQLTFLHRISGTAGTPTVHVRSSLDNFAADIYSVQITTSGTNINETVNLPASFLNIYSTVEFRFYITGAAAATGTYRHDNVTALGFINALSTQTYYADADGDGFGDAATSITNCVPPVGYVADNTDCDDTNDAFFPGAVWYEDTDGDGFGDATSSLVQCTQPAGYVADNTDCDDTDNAITSAITYYEDLDGDGFGNAAVEITACTQPGGYVTNNTDCDDTDNSIGNAGMMFYADTDSDTYGDPNNTIMACSQPVGYVSDNTDCDDTNPSTYPGAPEVCDGEDNNCDNNIDEGLTTFTWYQDADGDGNGNSAVTTVDCQQPAGYVGNANDCDDTDNSPTAGQEIYYFDQDSDNFGDSFNALAACEAPNGYVLIGGDCDDSDAAINPNATETFGNGIDENCDGVDGNLSVGEDVIGNFTLAPNPGTNEVTLTFVHAMTEMQVELIAVDGKIVPAAVTSTNSNTLTIETSNILPGMYLIRISQDGVSKTARWMKK